MLAMMKRLSVTPFVAAVLVLAMLGGEASAMHWTFSDPIGNGIPPGGRGVGSRFRGVVGVGMRNYIYPDQAMCVGGKANSDGSGGNIVPFTCTTLALDQTVWTPGGSYGIGYPTLINRMTDRYATTEGIVNATVPG